MIDINPFIEIIPRGNINSYSWSCPWNNLYLFGSFINESQNVNSYIFHYDKINKKRRRDFH